MGKLRANNGVIHFKAVAKKLQKKLSMGKKWSSNYEEMSVPQDVKEGHFAVIAVDGEEPKRFVVSLSYLNHPTFLRLLESAAEEYGFEHEGALAVPCSPHELETILAGEQWV